jgi:hypothetical protein
MDEALRDGPAPTTATRRERACRATALTAPDRPQQAPRYDSPATPRQPRRSGRRRRRGRELTPGAGRTQCEQRGGMCFGMSARPLWRPEPGAERRGLRRAHASPGLAQTRPRHLLRGAARTVRFRSGGRADRRRPRALRRRGMEDARHRPDSDSPGRTQPLLDHACRGELPPSQSKPEIATGAWSLNSDSTPAHPAGRTAAPLPLRPARAVDGLDDRSRSGGEAMSELLLVAHCSTRRPAASGAPVRRKR